MRRGPTKVHIGKDFLDLGSRSAVDLALYRLAKNNTIQRVGRGLYDVPRVNPSSGLSGCQTSKRSPWPWRGKREAVRFPPELLPRIRWVCPRRSRQDLFTSLTVEHAEYQWGTPPFLFGRVSPKDLPLGSVMTVLVFQALRHLGQKDVGAETIERIRRSLLPADRRRLLKETHHVTDRRRRLFEIFV